MNAILKRRKCECVRRITALVSDSFAESRNHRPAYYLIEQAR